MKILSIGKILEHKELDITSIETSLVEKNHDITPYTYIIISGGDGTIRRVLNQLHTTQNLPPFILNPTGSFNVVAKLHHVSNIEKILDLLAQNKSLNIQKHKIYKLNNEIFLFSAGNMGDLQHIFLSETLRFGILKDGIAKYILSVLFLLPIHIIMTPFMLMSKTRFFIFTPLNFIKKFGSFYGEVKEINIHLNNHYNMIELDGDIILIHEAHLHIRAIGNIDIVIE